MFQNDLVKPPGQLHHPVAGMEACCHGEVSVWGTYCVLLLQYSRQQRSCEGDASQWPQGCQRCPREEAKYTKQAKRRRHKLRFLILLVLVYFPYFQKASLHSEKRKRKFSQQLFLVLCLFSTMVLLLSDYQQKLLETQKNISFKNRRKEGQRRGTITY